MELFDMLKSLGWFAKWYLYVIARLSEDKLLGFATRHQPICWSARVENILSSDSVA